MISSIDIDKAILDSRYYNEGGVNREGLISHREEGSSEEFLTWFSPCLYGLPLSVDSYREASIECGYSFSEDVLEDRVRVLTENWELDFIEHCKEVGRFRHISMCNKKGSPVRILTARRVFRKYDERELMISCGVCYTGAAFDHAFRLNSFNLNHKYYPTFKRLRDRIWEDDISELVGFLSSIEFRNISELCVLVNGQGFVTSTGKAFSTSSLGLLLRAEGVSIKDYRTIGQRDSSDKVLVWHKRVHMMYRKAVDDIGALNSGQVVAHWNKIGFLSKHGKAWGRWSLCLLIQKHSDWDWSCAELDRTSFLEKVREHWEEGKYQTLEDFKRVVGIPYTQLVWAMGELGYSIEYYESNEYKEWLDMVRGVLSEVILYSGTGYARIAKFLTERGVASRQGGGWYPSTVQRLCMMHNIDREEEYQDAFIRGYSDWCLMEGDIVGVLNKLGIYPPNVRGRYAKWTTERLDAYLSE
jgi:hypothetical protein